MRQSWNSLTFIHWEYDPRTVQALLPPGLDVDLFGGSAWVGMTPFLAMVRPPFGPAFLRLRFPETNLRTYVRGPDGRAGVWFFSLDAARISAVAGARAMYGLPYQYSRMRVAIESERIEYASRRVWPKAGAHAAAIVEPLEILAPGELEIFLTARWRLYSLRRGELIRARVEHPPWPLYAARLNSLDQDLIPAAGLPAPAGAPRVHFSPGVDVRVGPPERTG